MPLEGPAATEIRDSHDEGWIVAVSRVRALTEGPNQIVTSAVSASCEAGLFQGRYRAVLMHRVFE